MSKKTSKRLWKASFQYSKEGKLIINLSMNQRDKILVNYETKYKKRKP